MPFPCTFKYVLAGKWQGLLRRASAYKIME